MAEYDENSIQDKLARPQDKEILDVLSKESPSINNKPSDTIPPKDRGDLDIDEQHLSGYLLYLLKNDIFDKQEAGWGEKRLYDLRAYYEVKDKAMSEFPWANASNFPEPITPVLLDVGHSAIMGSIWKNPYKTVNVRGTTKEDVHNAENLSILLNWQVGTAIDNMERELDGNTFQTFLHGTSILKAIRSVGDSGEFKIDPATIPIERIFMPIDSNGVSIKDSDHVIQIIPLTSIEMLQRKAMGVYKNLEQVGKGYDVASMTHEDDLISLRKTFEGIDLSRKFNRDTYFIAEAYVNYVPKNSFKPIELVVWFSPSTGAILRVRKNLDNMRPYADFMVYPNHGKAYHRSLPEIIRHIQEKANYTDKQVTDAADKAISPAAFYEEGSGFNPAQSLRAPTGMYPMQNAKSIIFEPINIAPIMERARYLDVLWNKAERRTGFTDLFQGVYGQASTATGDVMRARRADSRFETIYNRYNLGWKKFCNLLYFYDDKYMPRDMKVKVLGTEEIKTIEQLFPKSNPDSQFGLQIEGKYDFNLDGQPITAIETEKQTNMAVATSVLAHPFFGSDRGVAWKMLKLQSESLGFKDFENYVPKPREAYILSPEEVIMRLMGREKDINPSVEIDPTLYANRLQMFMLSENFKSATDEVKAEFAKFIVKLQGIYAGRMQAFNDFQITQAGNQMVAQNAAQMQAGGEQPVTPQTPQGQSQEQLPSRVKGMING